MTCIKKCFPYRDAAKRSIRAIGRRRSVELRAYQCSSCHGWHLTSEWKR